MDNLPNRGVPRRIPVRRGTPSRFHRTQPNRKANTMTDTLPVRYCHGCAAYDDHPRVTHIADMHQPASDKLYHYDCVPADVIANHPEVTPIVDAAKSGTHGDELREAAARHAANITEAPAHTKES